MHIVSPSPLSRGLSEQSGSVFRVEHREKQFSVPQPKGSVLPLSEASDSCLSARARDSCLLTTGEASGVLLACSEGGKIELFAHMSGGDP